MLADENEPMDEAGDLADLDEDAAIPEEGQPAAEEESPAGAPPPGGEESGADPDDEASLSLADVAAVFASGSEESAATAGLTGSETQIAAESAAEGAVQPASSQASVQVVAAAAGRVEERLVSEEALQAPGPEPGSGMDESQIVTEMRPDQDLLKLLVSEERIQQLWARADELQAQISAEINNRKFAFDMINRLRSAKTQLLVGREYYEQAERQINEIDYRLAYSRRARGWNQWAYALFAYEVLWLIVITLLSFYAPLLLKGFVENAESVFRFTWGGQTYAVGFPDFMTPAEAYNLAGSMVAGGFGGVVGAMYALWRYLSEEQFAPQHTLWYISQPVMGLPIGAFIFLFFKLSFSIVTTGNAQVDSPWLLFALAFVAGFQQKVLYELIRQFLKRLRIRDREA